MDVISYLPTVSKGPLLASMADRRDEITHLFLPILPFFGRLLDLLLDPFLNF